MKDEPSSEETKLCPYCMGEISVNANKCSHCGEELENKDKENLKQEGKDTVKREARKQIQDKFGKKTTQKSMAKSKGIKSWWAGQSTGVKAFMVVLLGVAVIGGAYMAFGTNQAPLSVITIDNTTNSSSDSSNVKMVSCPTCNGTGKITHITEKNVTCTNCSVAKQMSYPADNVVYPMTGGSKPEIVTYYECDSCHGKGYITKSVKTEDTCPTCNGKGKIPA